jgi:hypothetical protein
MELSRAQCLACKASAGGKVIDSVDIERGLLAAVVINPSLRDQANGITEDYFSIEPHRLIWRGCQTMTAAGVPIDEETLLHWLRTNNLIDRVGGSGFVRDLISNCGIVRKTIAYHVAQLRKAAAARFAIREAEAILRQGASGLDPEYIADKYEAVARQVREYASDNATGKTGLVLSALSDVQARAQEYLWEGYIPNNQLIALYGPSHTAKSIIATDWGARITSGLPWPDGTANRQGPRKVLMLSAGEDALDTVLKPRFIIAGGDPSKAIIVESSRRINADGEVVDDMVALDRDYEAIAEVLDKDPSVGMIIIDPITNHLGSRKMNAEEEIRPMLMKLKQLAERFTVPVVVIGHFNRREKGTAALDRMMGARAFSGVARTIYLTGPDNNSTEKHHYVMVQERGLGAKAWNYKTELVESEVDGTCVNQVRLMWDSQTEATGQDVVDTVTGEEKSAEADAAEELRAYLERNGGTAAGEDCKKALGFPKVNWYRVRAKAGVDSKRSGTVGGTATWKLSNPPSVQENPSVRDSVPVSVPTGQYKVSKSIVLRDLPRRYNSVGTTVGTKGSQGVLTENPTPVGGPKFCPKCRQLTAQKYSDGTVACTSPTCAATSIRPIGEVVSTVSTEEVQ